MIMSEKTAPVEAKVKASSVAAGATGLVLSLSSSVFGEVPSAVEQMVTSGIGTLVPAGLTFLAGWITRHTPRGWVDFDVE